MAVKSFDMPIIGDSNKVPQDDPSYTLNLYAEKVSDTVFTLKPTPGSVADSQLTIGGAGRGLVTVDGRLFGVRGGFFQEKVAGAWVVRGTLASTTGNVKFVFANNPDVLSPDFGKDQILIVDDDTGYVFELDTDTFTALSTVSSFQGGGAQTCFCGGRALVFKPGTTYFQASDPYDFLTWNDTSYEAMESLSTALLAIISNGDLIYGFSSDGFEVWQIGGDNPVFPFIRILSGDKIGILAPQSALFIERIAYWLGKSSTGDGVIYRHTGGAGPERISNHSTERQIAAMTGQADCVGDTYNSLGHVFYLMTFTQGNTTLCWDKTTNLWHDRAVRKALTNQMYCLPYFSLIAYGSDILGIKRGNGQVIKLDNDVFTDEGDPIARERILPVVPKEGDYLTYYQSVELFAQYGNTPVNQADPQIMMRYSTDRGMTWSMEEWQQSGGNSTYAGRTRWVGLGAAYGLSFWFKLVAAQYISWRSIRIWSE